MAGLEYLDGSGAGRWSVCVGDRTMKTALFGAAWVSVLLLAIFMPRESHAHGLAGKVPNHHKWINMAVDCETRGITNRWRFNGSHDGGLQFNPSTWRAAVAPYPQLRRYAFAYQAPAWVQIRVAEHWRLRAGLSQWTCAWAWR